MTERVVPNLISNAAGFVIRIGIALWFVPFLVKQLGPAAYGLVPLAVTITAYMSIATTAIGSALSRDLMSHFANDKIEAANRVFNTALFGLIALGLLLIIPLGVFSVFVDSILTIPSGQETAAKWLFGYIGAGFILTAIASPFAASAMVRHRFDFINGVAIIENILRVAITVLVFLFFFKNVSVVGAATLAATAAGIACYVGIWKKLTPELSIRLSDFRRNILKDLTTTGGWVVVGHTGSLLLLSIDLILVNRLFGADAGGRYALALQWALLLRALAGAIAGTFTPTLTTLFAEGDLPRAARMLRRAIKSVALCIALPVALICGFASPLLQTWLGPEFSDLNWLLILLVGPLILNVPFTPVFSLALAANCIRRYGLVTLAFGIANPILAYILAVPCNWGIFGIAASSGILLFLRGFIFDTSIASRILSENCNRNLLDVLLATTLAIAAGFVGHFVTHTFELTSWFTLGLGALPVALLFGGIAWFILLNSAERFQLTRIFQRK